VGPRAGLDRCGKSRPPLGFDPQTFEPVVSPYTDYTVPALLNIAEHSYRNGALLGPWTCRSTRE